MEGNPEDLVNKMSPHVGKDKPYLSRRNFLKAAFLGSATVAGVAVGMELGEDKEGSLEEMEKLSAKAREAVLMGTYTFLMWKAGGEKMLVNKFRNTSDSFL